jgi:hypothetical protein
MQVLVPYLTASQLWKKEKKVTSYNNTALPIQQPPQVVSKSLNLSLSFGFFLFLHLRISRKGIIRSPLVPKCHELRDSFLQWHWLSTVLARSIITVPNVDFSSIHLLVADDYIDVSTENNKILDMAHRK